MLGQVQTITQFDNSDEPVNPERHEQNFVYTAGVLTSEWFTDYKNTWTKTYSYDGVGKLVKISRWIKS